LEEAGVPCSRAVAEGSIRHCTVADIGGNADHLRLRASSGLWGCSKSAGVGLPVFLRVTPARSDEHSPMLILPSATDPPTVRCAQFPEHASWYACCRPTRAPDDVHDVQRRKNCGGLDIVGTLDREWRKVRRPQNLLWVNEHPHSCRFPRRQWHRKPLTTDEASAGLSPVL